jgi:PilZ domain
MQQLRRLLPRHFTDWRARYMIEGDPEERWRDCRIVDMSSAGAGLELLDANPEETAGKSIVIALHLRGEVRHAEPAKNQRLRTGVQFVDISEEHRVYLQSLAELEALW